MKYIKRWAALLAVIAFVVSVVSLPVAMAQDGPSDEDIAQIERFVAGFDQRDAYTSFAIEERSTQDLVGSISLGPVSQDLVQRSLLTRTSMVIQSDGEPENINSTAVLEVEEVNPGAPPSGYSLNAEIRYVDGVIYVNATSPDAVDFALPEGWVEVDVDNILPGLDELGLEDFFDDDEEEEPNPFEDAELLSRVVSTVRVQSATAPDGRDVEELVMTVSFGRLVEEAPETFGDLTEDEDNPLTPILIQAFNENDAIITLAMDSDGNLAYYSYAVTISIPELDMGELDPELEGATFSLEMVFSEEVYLSQYNEAFEPVGAPE